MDPAAAPSPGFPATRLRRLRYNPRVREMVKSMCLEPRNFILPLFVHSGEGLRREIASMPGQFQLSTDELVKECKQAEQLGLGGVILFGIPDEKDIADCTTDPACADCDENGVPDGCDDDCDNDGTPDACETLIDCNSNDIFDACEYDCDGDGVPDDCELSGNDCNENLTPDNCEIDFPPPFNLPDCNDNGIPDSCDIADCESDPDCDDCNSNNIPDECDIANEISDDTNENGIPDECETESMVGGGGTSSPTGGESSESESSELTEAEKWNAYMTWCFETDFTSMTSGQKFSAALYKRLDLGLPAAQMLP